MVAGQHQEVFLLTTSELEKRVRKLSRELIPKPVEKIMWGSLEELGDHHREARKEELRNFLISNEVANFLKLDPKYFAIGAMAQDVGKKDIPLTTLNKSYSRTHGNWTDEDMEIMKKHVDLGYAHFIMKAESDKLSESQRADLYVGAWVALTHHRWQKDPYPEQLPLVPEILSQSGLLEVAIQSSKIGSFSDKYGACYRDNPKYDGPLTHEQAKEEMFKLNPEDLHPVIARLFDDDTGIF